MGQAQTKRLTDSPPPIEDDIYLLAKKFLWNKSYKSKGLRPKCTGYFLGLFAWRFSSLVYWQVFIFIPRFWRSVVLRCLFETAVKGPFSLHLLLRKVLTLFSACDDLLDHYVFHVQTKFLEIRSARFRLIQMEVWTNTKLD